MKSWREFLENNLVWIVIKTCGDVTHYLFGLKGRKRHGHIILKNGNEIFHRNEDDLSVGISNNGWIYIINKNSQILSESELIAGIDFVGIPPL